MVPQLGLGVPGGVSGGGEGDPGEVEAGGSPLLTNWGPDRVTLVELWEGSLTSLKSLL